MPQIHYAHTKTAPDGTSLPEVEWQPLENHLDGVSTLAAHFASAFAAEQWGRLAGLWHDIGKYSDDFQNYLRAASSLDVHNADSVARTDHSTAGAQHAARSLEVLGHILAYAIAGHHSGLLDAISSGGDLLSRLKKSVAPWTARSDVLDAVTNLDPPPVLAQAFSRRDAFSVAFFTRMIFSCLVDADFLDTEAFMDSERSTSRMTWPRDILQRMDGALAAFVSTFGSPQNKVDRARHEVRRACIEATELPPGLFSLTVPTGGGKTLASLAFALKHAQRHNMVRVIYVIPFTSIIEQNADVFRAVFRSLTSELGAGLVLEHHSNFDPDNETTQSRLATENWDAPLVVTTSVQFYESLFASRTSRCRKLHNLARSVVILDEAQTLPVDYLEPCLRALRELTAYNSTVVLCTATQPAVMKRNDFRIGLEHVREIIPDPPRLYLNLKRVRTQDLGQLSDDDLGKRLLDHPQALCVVNTRNHARRLFELVTTSPGTFHLSAQMCPEHRSVVLTTIRQRLDDGTECRVVSTQLIEAGVDVDFPVVYRSMAGLDSIAQAAGRCNRNGTNQNGGATFIFRSEHTRSERFFADTAQIGAQVLGLYPDPLSLAATNHYFKLYYWDQESRWDHKKICRSFSLQDDVALPFLFKFASVAKEFKLIEDSGKQLVIPWGDTGRGLVDELRNPRREPTRALLRRLQRFTIRIHRRVWDQHVGRDIELAHERYPFLIFPEAHYNDQLGLNFNNDTPVFLGV